MFKRIAQITSIIVILGLVLSVQSPQPVESAPAFPGCRYNLTIGNGGLMGDLASTRAGGVLDWGMENHSIPTGVEYMHVLRVGDRYSYTHADCQNRRNTYADTLANLPTVLAENPGAVWLVGNEPDTNYDCQDSLTAENYAERFYAVANMIRRLDPSARIGFGSIVQPTPIRLRYLDRAWNRLVQLAGSSSRASSLIDIWSIHSFILNEWPNGWGTGVPAGFENDYADAIRNDSNFALTYDINSFKPRIVRFRDWLNKNGERNKPLWITEYGSLIPPQDPPGGPDYPNVTDDQTAKFLTATFDYLNSATNVDTGLPSDGNRLVQRWFWVSLSNRRYVFGGTLYDPESTPTAGAITTVGSAWVNYVAAKSFKFDYGIRGISILPIVPENPITPWSFKIDIYLENNGEANDLDGVSVNLYDGDPSNGGALVGSTNTHVFYGCGSRQEVSFDWNDVIPPDTAATPKILFVQIDSTNDSNAANNLMLIPVYFLPHHVLLPVVMRNY